MDTLIFHNGSIIPLSKARLSPGQMGLLMGWGVFTTLRVYEGKPFAFDRHWARMSHDAERLSMSLGYEQEAVCQSVSKLAEANGRPEGTARVSFVKNRGGLWADAGDSPETDLLIFTRQLVEWPAVHRLKLQQHALYSATRLAGAKMLSWVQNAGLLEKAHAEGFDDVLLLNESGHLAECTSANIFLVRDSRVLTPPLASGCLPGVTRDVLREVVPQAGFELSEQNLTLDDLASASEVFISSTTREVAAVGSIDAQWRFTAPGKITMALERCFKDYVRAYLKTC
ncbi:MAG: aminotransferase class IV [Terriglobia bacterium]|jgi:branched-chain amino acid aminotransferase